MHTKSGSRTGHNDANIKHDISEKVENTTLLSLNLLNANIARYRYFSILKWTGNPSFMIQEHLLLPK